MSQQQRYPILRSKVDTTSDTYRANHKENFASLGEVLEAQAAANRGGGSKYVVEVHQSCVLE